MNSVKYHIDINTPYNVSQEKTVHHIVSEHKNMKRSVKEIDNIYAEIFYWSCGMHFYNSNNNNNNDDNNNKATNSNFNCPFYLVLGVHINVTFFTIGRSANR